MQTCSKNTTEISAKQLPILFSPPMVQAIQAGRKTQTRRIIKAALDDRGLRWANPKTGWEDWHSCPVKCPYGKIGDILWVRETYYEYGSWQRRHNPKKGRAEWYFAGKGQYAYIGDPLESTVEKKRVYDKLGWYKRPALFMPFEACRLFLRITDIWGERLQDISEDDAKAEGLSCLSKDNGITYKWGIPDRDGLPGNDDHGWHWRDWEIDPRMAFKHLWESINGPGSWSNHWVWVVNYETQTGSRYHLGR
jgi:hypothetical protein